MDASPLVTVMIPTYNQSSIIGGAIESILNQKYVNLEILILDDCSDDDTELTVKKYTDFRIRYIKNSKNLGRVGNYRQGLYLHSKGEWVLNLDGDDFLTDDYYIGDCIDILTKNKETVLIYSGYSKTKKIGVRSQKFIKYSGPEFLLNRYRQWEFNHMTSLYHRATAISVGFYTQNILSSDAASVLKLCAIGNIIKKEGIAGYWYSHTENFTTQSKISSKIENYRTLTNSITEFFYTKHRSKISTSQLKTWQGKMGVQYLTPLILESIVNGSFKEFSRVINSLYDEIGLRAIFMVPKYILQRIVS